MPHIGWLRELAYIISVLQECAQPQSCCACMPTLSMYIYKVAYCMLILWPLLSLLMSSAKLQIGDKTSPGQVFCRIQSGFHSQVLEYREVYIYKCNLSTHWFPAALLQCQDHALFFTPWLNAACMITFTKLLSNIFQRLTSWLIIQHFLSLHWGICNNQICKQYLFIFGKEVALLLSF